MEILSSGTRMAKKEHVCGFCNSIIKKGEKYEYQEEVKMKQAIIILCIICLLGLLNIFKDFLVFLLNL